MIIRCCSLATSRDAAGIDLENVANVVIEEYAISGADTGVVIFDSDNLIVTNNQISD
ncbi:hypothetical protein EU537_03370 [Candidatus Thorarchaeota archaeon]|nr:MAG: hypothetical protein EU537_03370 [Candidatus Thorarchaeota archaeon]